MKTINQSFTMDVLNVAVQGALAAMLAMPLMAMAEDAASAGDASNAEAAELKRPSNFVEIGAMNVTHESAKFGEYNGLNDARVYGVGNFDIRGGTAYEGNDGTVRWQAKGIDLGTTSRSMGATVSNQGQWNLGVGYDELRHNITDSYQTPLQGNMGGSNFVLPNNFGIINTSSPGSTAVNGGTRGLTATQKADFQNQDVYTERKNKSFSAGYELDSQTNFQFDYNRLDQDGAKLISSATEARPYNGLLTLAPPQSGTSSSATNKTYYVGQAIMVLMNPTKYQTDTVNMALNWTGDQGRLSASYFGSFFSDKNNGLSWSNPFGAQNGTGVLSPTGTPTSGFPTNTLSTAPDNQFQQLNLTGGYNFSSATKLAGGLSYGRNTQDDSYLTNSLNGALPRNSFDGVAINTNANLKLTNQATKDLALSAGVKFNERDNLSSSNTYNWYAVDGTGTSYTAYNTPYSNKTYNVELAGDYRFNSRNDLRVAYDYDKIQRWCNDLAGNCVSAADNYENRLGLDYRFKASDSVNLNAGYSYGDRKANTNSSYYNPMQASTSGFDVNGFVPYFEASRKEQIAKAGVNWQATDRLDLGLTGRYLHDDYNDSTLGLQSGHTWSLNTDATFSYSENGTVSAYASMQKRWRDMLNAANGSATTAPTQLWNNDLNDDEYSIGLNAKQKGLMGGKLELLGDLSYVYGTSGYNTNLYYTPGTTCATNLACGSTPDITNKLWQVKLNGNYQVNKHSKVGLGYLFQKLDSNDYYYNAYQTGYTPNTLLPTNQQDQSYSVNVVIATYSYDF